ncbi:MAG: hypothetical protein GC150_00795 [Rhizobiales bacterium]|nr:hypothetical protein [Hyphomicrobiales bacterium]
MGSHESLRLLIYSHDSFGLGHLRRCRAIAHSLVEHRRDLSVLILTGSPIIGSYNFRSRVDFVRFPGVVKLRNGGYTSHGLDISIEAAIAIRQTIIRCSAEEFDPHIFLVDKEPMGLRGEVMPTLALLKSRGARLVLGLRDILDDQEMLREEWERKGSMQALRDYYDDIWVYGSKLVADPLEGIDVPDSVRRRMTFTGYLRRTASGMGEALNFDGVEIEEPYILVTTGGGGDGTALVDSVLRAYEHDRTLPHRALVVMGPFMDRDAQANFLARIGRLEMVQAIDFVPNMEDLMIRSIGVVAMGGYNTVCEILSFDKPALIVPRSVPRLEQTIRAERMQDLGLLGMLSEYDAYDPMLMAARIRQLPHQPRPSSAGRSGLLDGFSMIRSIVDRWAAMGGNMGPQLAVVSGSAE